jgi:phage terminase small subunit
MPRKNTLMVRELRFVEAYLVCRNATQAAEEAGYSRRSADVAGSRLLNRDKVLNEIRAREAVVVAAIEKDTEITLARLVRELAASGFADPMDLFSSDGVLLALPEMPERIRRAITCCEVVERFEQNGERLITHRVTKIRFADKLRAIDLIARLYGYFEHHLRDRPREVVLRWAEEGDLAS